MNKTEIMNAVSRKFYRIGFQLKKHSPEILVVAGVVGTVTSTVMACKATTKISSILEETKNTIDVIHETTEKAANDENIDYTPEDAKKDLAIVYVQTGVKVAKLYAPAVALGVLSLASIVKSHDILSKRNAALAAAYATVDKGFKEYRGRVIERFGKELDRELKYNIKAQEVESVVVNEKGKEKVVKETVEVGELNEYSDYARVFDDGCTGWSKDPEYNMVFLKQQQRYANDLLQAKGHLFLNEVYDMLGIHRSQAGQVVGWIYDEENPVGDNYVDFGLYDIGKEANRRFINGIERNIILEFNVDGNILGSI